LNGLNQGLVYIDDVGLVDNIKCINMTEI